MKIIVNLEPLIGRLAGIGIFTREILLRFRRDPKIDEIVYFLGHRPLSQQEADAIFNDDYTKPAVRHNLVWLIAILRRFAPEILWALSNYLFWWRTRNLQAHNYIELNNIARPFKGKTLVVCHDLSHLRYPEYLPEVRRDYFLRYFKKSVLNATVLTTVSNAISKELEVSFSRPADLIATPAIVFGSNDDIDLQGIRHKFNLPKEFILSVGAMEPRKNLDTLIDAHNELSIELKQQFPLVLVGDSGWENDLLKKKIDKLKAAGQIISLGYVDQDDLQALYHAATFLAYISHYEGFGIPVLEAMSCDTPVLISMNDALVETAGGAALMVDGTKLNDVTTTLTKLLKDPDLQKELVLKGRENIKRFSWNNSASCILEYLNDSGQTADDAMSAGQ